MEAEGTDSAREMGSKADEWPVDNLAEYERVKDYFERGSGTKDYDWVILDSLDELEEHVWLHQMTSAKTRNRNRPEYKKALGDYPVVWDTIKREVNQWNRLPVNVLYTCKTMRIDGEDPETEEDRSVLMPLLGSTKRGDTSARVCGMVSLVGLLRVIRSPDGAQQMRRLHTESSNFWVAKSRHQILTPRIDRPNIATMAQAVRTGVTAPPRPRTRRPEPSTKE
jgi:hypothetical protein